MLLFLESKKPFQVLYFSVYVGLYFINTKYYHPLSTIHKPFQTNTAMFPSSTFALVAMAALIFSIGVDSCGRRGSARCGSIVSNVEITFYGAPDNDPPGDETAWSCDDSRGTHAAGTGAYDDPLSFASAEGEYEQCEIVYLPYLRKYLRFDDYCQQCSEFSLSISSSPLYLWQKTDIC